MATIVLLVGGAAALVVHPPPAALPARPLRLARRGARPVATATSDVEDALLKLLPSSAPEADALIAELIGRGGIERPALSPAIEGDWTLLQTSSSDFDLRNPLGRRTDGSAPGLEGAIAAISERVGPEARCEPRTSDTERSDTGARASQLAAAWLQPPPPRRSSAPSLPRSRSCRRSACRPASRACCRS